VAKMKMKFAELYLSMLTVTNIAEVVTLSAVTALLVLAN
jgi:hypothetical protein